MHMSIAPFSPHPAPAAPGAQAVTWRTRLAVASVTVGIAATILAYAISPGLRHAVSHAEHSVGHAVTRVFDRDSSARKHAPKAKLRTPAARKNAGARASSKHGAASTNTSPAHH